MKYTYKISEHANSEVFAALKRDIEYLYPEFPFEKEIKDADGSRTDFFRCKQTGESIAAELSYANNNIVVTSDVCMVELADKYKVAKAEPYEKKPSYISFDFNFKRIPHALFRTPFGVKLFVVPLILFAFSFIVELFRFGGVNLLSGNSLWGVILAELLGSISVFLVIAAYGGGLMFIPSALLSGWFAEKKGHFLYKVPLSAFLIFSELHFLIFYCYNVYDYIQIKDIPAILGIYLIRILPYILIEIYLMNLPIIIADEFAAGKHKKLYGERARGWQSAIWWSGTAAAMLAVLIVFAAVLSSIGSAKENDIAVKETVNVHAAVGPLLEEHEAAMRTVADYAVAHDYYDWYCCPDESVKNEWQELFEDESEYIFDYGLLYHGGFRFNVFVRNGEGKGHYSIRFDGEDIYVNGTLYNEKEVEYYI